MTGDKKSVTVNEPHRELGAEDAKRKVEGCAFGEGERLRVHLTTAAEDGGQADREGIVAGQRGNTQAFSQGAEGCPNPISNVCASSPPFSPFFSPPPFFF